MKSIDGQSINGQEDEWKAICPYCGNEEEWSGYFDSTDKYECFSCKKKYKVKRVWIDDEHYLI